MDVLLDDGSPCGLRRSVGCDAVCVPSPGHALGCSDLQSASARMRRPVAPSALDLPPAVGAQPLAASVRAQKPGELVWSGDPVCAVVEMPVPSALDVARSGGSEGGDEDEFYEDDVFVTLEDGTTLALRVQLPVNRVYELPVADE